MINIIVAHDKNLVIGNEGRIPWQGKLPADMQRFRALTIGHTVVMGRVTYDSIGKPLPERRNVVVTRQPNLRIEGVDMVNSLDQALEVLQDEEQIFIAGGARIYELAMPVANRLYVTEIEAEFEGDTFFIAINQDQWKLTREEHCPADERNQYNYAFKQYERIG
ncbi:dihydrofolate reductase [Candidatus Microgenomates bacterium]|nr:dihydrofolate reductase [Candidatus Microgenomates bacterium]